MAEPQDEAEPSYEWNDDEESPNERVAGAFVSQEAALQLAAEAAHDAFSLLLEMAEPYSKVARGDHEVFEELARPLGSYYNKVVRRGSFSMAAFFIEESRAGRSAWNGQYSGWRSDVQEIFAPCIDAFDALIEAGATFLQQELQVCMSGGNTRVTSQPDLFEVVMKLNLGTHTAVETAGLARHGFSHAVTVRARRLHEAAVIAMVLDAYADDLNLNLIKRYNAHQYVRQYRSFSRFAVTLETSGVDVPAEFQDQLANAKREYDRVVELYGKGFASDLGWARALVDERLRVTLSRLEDLVPGRLSRIDYLLASAIMHGTTTGDISQAVSGMRGGIDHASRAWFWFVLAMLSLLKHDYVGPRQRLAEETMLRLKEEVDHSLDFVEEQVNVYEERLYSHIEEQEPKVNVQLAKLFNQMVEEDTSADW